MENLVTASRYNIMQQKVAIVLGNGAGYLGYGQDLNSSQVDRNTVIDDVHMNAIKLDLIDAYVHQTGTLPTLTTVNEGDTITEDIWLQYEAIANYVRENADDVFKETQISTELKLSVQRKQGWGGDGQPQTIYHEFTVTFDSEDALRHFFNTGGVIIFQPSLTGITGSKSQDWQSLLSAINNVRYSRLGADGVTGFPEAIGPLELTQEYQRLYIKTGSGIYVENTYTINAKRLGNVLNFSVEFYDGEANFLDEPIEGTLTHNIIQERATGLYVETPSPLYRSLKALS